MSQPVECRPKGHCWHPTGRSADYLTGSGAVEFRCCHCAAPGLREYRTERKREPGHGRYWSKEVTTWGEVFAVSPAPVSTNSVVSRNPAEP